MSQDKRDALAASCADRTSLEDLAAHLEARRSVPITLLGEPGPNAAQLHRMLAIATRVPDHGGLEPWRFIVIEGEARARAGERLRPIYAAENPSMEAEKREKFAGVVARSLGHAPVVVIVVSRTDPAARIPSWEQDLSAGAVCMNLLHAAHALGFAGAWLTGWAAASPGARGLFGIAESERIAGIIYIGTAKETPGDRKRPDVATIATWWRDGVA